MNVSIKTLKSGLLTLIVWFSVLLGIFTAVWIAVNEHEFSGLYALAFLAVIFVFAFISSKQTQKYLELMKALPGDHKLISNHTSAIDVGNFRFIFNTYVKGNLMNPFCDLYLSMTVGIPFPVDDLTAKVAIKDELRSLISGLKEEGMLTYSRPMVDDTPLAEGVTWIGQTLSLEFLLKRVTSPWLVGLQRKVLDIIDRHGLQNLTYCTICGLAGGSEYRLNKGNMFISKVYGGFYDSKPHRFSYKDTSWMNMREFESYFSVDSYRDLYDSAVPYESWLSIGVMEKVLKRMFKESKTRGTVLIEKEKEGIHVNIRVASENAAGCYHLTKSSGYWWIYSEGSLDIININPMSTEDEAFACLMFYNILGKYADGSYAS